MTTLIIPSETNEIIAGLSANIEALGEENRQLRERLAEARAETRRLALEEAARVADGRASDRAALIAKGKGVWPSTGYVPDDIWAQWQETRNEAEAIALAIRALASGGERAGGRFCPTCGEHLGAKPCDHCARIDAEESTKPPPEERGEAGEPVRYACAPCQMVGVVVDEDGCCATCGADAVPVDASGRVSFVAEQEHARTLLESFEHNAARGLKKTLVVIRRKGPPAGEFARTSLGRGEIANAIEEADGWRWAVYVETTTAIRRLRLALAGGVPDGR